MQSILFRLSCPHDRFMIYELKTLLSGIMRCIYALVSLFISPMLFSQQLLFENYTSLQGLSQNSGYTISQDANGFMWFGTQDGLNRYDGRQFKVYSQQNEIGKNLPANIISSLFFDLHKNLLWVGTIQGACIYHPLRDSLLKISALFSFASRLEKLPIKKIISFREDEYWIITFDSGLLCLNTRSGTLNSFFTDEAGKANVTSIVLHEGKIIVSLLYSLYVLLPSEQSYRVELLHADYPFAQIRELFSYNNALWIGTMAAGCYYINSPIAKKENISSLKIVFGGIGGFSTDNNNNLWIGTRGSGIYKYNAQTNSTVRAINNQYDPTSPCSNFSLSMFTDRQGIIWCGLSGGIAKYDPLRYQFSNIDEKSSLNGSLSDKVIPRMYTCKDGVTFVGTQNKGIMEWEKATNQFKRYPQSETVGTANNVIYDITEDDKGSVWVASCGGLMQLERKTKKITYFSEKKLPELNKLYALIKLKKTDSLLIASENGLRFFSLKEKKWLNLPASL
ncbi:MAG TPA: two-component regulator propeller domain-containing protein, partial [Chitinophagaceae bacterium]|nr:two-component regulator propeller domain-containing protein [Chitinophagaceae bacterium]